jgi:hypothetical protein
MSQKTGAWKDIIVLEAGFRFAVTGTEDDGIVARNSYRPSAEFFE